MSLLRWRKGSLADEDRVALLQTYLPNRASAHGWLEYYEVYRHCPAEGGTDARASSLPGGWYARYYHFAPVEGGRRLLVQSEVASALPTDEEAMGVCEAHHAR